MAASTNFPAIAASADPRMTRACFSRSAWACRDMASCKATGIATSRISTDFTEMPQSAVLRPISPRNNSSAAVRSDKSADSIDDPILSRVMDEPEDDRIHVDRDGVFRQCRLGAERRGLNALIDDGHDVVDDRDDEKESRPLDA